MKKHLKVFGLVAVLMGLPLAFTGGTAETPVGVKINDGCADGGCCAFQIGSYCTVDGLELFNQPPWMRCGVEGTEKADAEPVSEHWPS